MSIRLETQLKTSIIPEHKLELKQQLVDQLQLLMPEFEEFFTFEDDEDPTLLIESFPFLMLHEMNHPLYSAGKLKVPDFSLSDEMHKSLTDDDIDSLYHHATEVGIDRGAILVATGPCGYSLTDIINSHAAITERVFRDMFDQQKHEATYGFVARLDAEVRIHYALLENKLARKRVNSLMQRVKKYVTENISSPMQVYNHIIKKYSEIYHNTSISSADMKTTGSKIAKFGI
jgi:hypothetical protein